MEKRILIVDDDKSMSRMMTTALKTLPLKLLISSVPSGEEALLSVILDHPALMIVDLGLPGMSGWDLLALVRKRNPKMSVILTTGSRDEEVLRRAREFNVNACFFKPIEMEEFLTKTQELLSDDDPIIEESAAAPAKLSTAETVYREDPEPEKKPSFNQIVRDLHQFMNAEAVAILADSGHLMAQTGKDLSTVLTEGWEIIVMAALSASLALGRVVNGPVNHQYQSLRTSEELTLLLLPVGPHGLLVLLPRKTAEALSTDEVNILFEAQKRMNEFSESFFLDDAGHLTTIVEEVLEEVHEEEIPAPIEIDLDALFSPSAVNEDLDAFWDQATESLAGGVSNTAFLNFSQAEQLGLVPEDLED